MKEYKVRVNGHVAHIYANSAKSAVKTANNLYYAYDGEVIK